MELVGLDFKLQSHDPTHLPVAGHEDRTVCIGDLRVDLGVSSITPLRERRINEARSATWIVRGAAAAELVRRVIDEAERRGLKRGAMFDPPIGGVEVWRGEAYSGVELVKARATVESGHVLLEIDYVDKRER